MNSSTLKGYLTGLILGDGYLDHGVAKRAFKIKSINEDFVNKIYQDISETTNFKIKIQSFDAHIGKDNTHHKKYYEFTIAAHPYFAKIYHKFYSDFRTRVISKDALESLNWEGWANWFMSDGYIVKVGKESGIIRDRRVQICTDRYPEKDIDFLVNHMQKIFNCKIKKLKRDDNFRIGIPLQNAQDFLYNISPFVVPSFYYKLDMAYTYRPDWMNDDYYNLMMTVQKCQSPIEKLDEEIV